MGLVVVLGGFGVVASSYMGAYLLGKHAGRREAEAQRALARDEEGPHAASMARIETAVDAVALEVERLAEGQRYLMLSRARPEQQPVPAPRTPAVQRHDTPV